MALIHLVRHGRASAGWATDPDPGLDELGQNQAESVAELLGGMGPLQVLSSPLLRCRETAAAFAGPRHLDVTVVDAVKEIPSPEGYSMDTRVDWLREAMTGEWASLGDRYTRYRDGAVAYVRAVDVATVVFSHFVVINAVIGACLDDDRLVIRHLDNCSLTTVSNDHGQLRLVTGGVEADTLIR